MGGKKNRMPAQNIRNLMRGLKNRWGRFQCPRDGSICKSLEAWHWHRHKYHQTENIDFVELGSEDHEDPRSSSSPPSSSLLSNFHRPAAHTSFPSSSRLLPAAAFHHPPQPLKPELLYPDDVSDLTEPEIPALMFVDDLAEDEEGLVPSDKPMRRSPEPEATLRTEAEVMDAGKQDIVQKDVNDTRQATREKSNSAIRGKTSAKARPKRQQAPRQEDSESSSSSSVSSSSQSSAFQLISVFVMEMLEETTTTTRSSKETIERIGPEVKSRFAWLGLSDETLMGVVTGTVTGAKERWRHGYDAGWRDGAKEVLQAPILRGLQQPPSTPDSAALYSGRVVRPDLNGKGQVNYGQGHGLDEAVLPPKLQINCGRISREQSSESPGERMIYSRPGVYHHSNDLNNNTAERSDSN